MKKKIVIEAETNEIKENKKNGINKIIEWLIYMIGYALVLIIVSILFKNSLVINNRYYGLYALLASIIIYILNKTIKPVLVYLTLPITALTLGLFYPVINVLILYITSFILGSNFQVHGIIIPFVIAILISLLNIFVEEMMIKPIINKRRDKYE